MILVLMTWRGRCIQGICLGEIDQTQFIIVVIYVVIIKVLRTCCHKQIIESFEVIVALVKNLLYMNIDEAFSNFLHETV